MSANCDFIVIFLIFDQFGAMRELDSGCIICKAYIFINSILLPYKNWKKSKKISNTAFRLLFWVRELFLPKMLMKLYTCLYLHTKFQVSGVIQTRFRHGGSFTLSHLKINP